MWRIVYVQHDACAACGACADQAEAEGRAADCGAFTWIGDGHAATVKRSTDDAGVSHALGGAVSTIGAPQYGGVLAYDVCGRCGEVMRYDRTTDTFVHDTTNMMWCNITAATQHAMRSLAAIVDLLRPKGGTE